MEKIIRIAGSLRVLGREFFGTNLKKLDGESCCLCKKKDLARDDRVDCEFWGDDAVSYCLKCWSLDK